MRIRIDGEVVIEGLPTLDNFNVTVYEKFHFSCWGAYTKITELPSLLSEELWNCGGLSESYKWSVAHNFKKRGFVLISGILIIECLGNIL